MRTLHRMRTWGGSTVDGNVALVAGLICLLVYLPALSCGFVNFDDQEFILNNVFIRRLDGDLLSWAFTSIPSFSGIWTPLVWISFAIDYRFWSLNPLGYHLTNILLHALNTSMVVLIAGRLLGGETGGAGSPLQWLRPDSPSSQGNTKIAFLEGGGREQSSGAEQNHLYAGMLFMAGLLYGIHPLRVESVAWVTERKDVLNGVFSFGSILFYLRYAQKKEVQKGRATWDYLISVLLLLLSFTAKPVSVTIPVMLLVVDWYPLGRLRKGKIRPILVEKVPYLISAAAFSVITLYFGAKEGGLLRLSEGFSFGQRAQVSGNAIFEYVQLMLYPVGILPLHIIPSPIPHAYAVKAIAVIFACAIVTRYRAWLAAWLCFILPLLPVLALFQTNDVAYAARYTYLPSAAPCIVAAVLVTAAYGKAAALQLRYPRFVVAGLAAALLVCYVAMTELHIGVWKDSGSMWSRVIEYQPFDKAYFLRGLFYVDTGNYPAGVEDYTMSLAIAAKEGLPGTFNANIHAFRGEALTKAGRFDEAVKDLSAAIAILPQPLYFYHRGLAFEGMGKVKEAKEDLRNAGGATGKMRWF